MSVVYAADWVIPVDGPPVRDGGVQVDGERIVAVGPADDLAGERRDHPGCVILPGLVNAHTHLEYATFAGFGDGLPFGQWIDVHIARKRLIGFDQLLDSARLGAAECLASGVTTVADASFSGAAALACAEAGLRGIVHLEVFGADAAVARERFAGIQARVDGSLDARVRLGVSPHAPYSTGAAVYGAALELGIPVQTHVAESDDEAEFMARGSGRVAELAAWAGIESPGATSVRHLVACGALRAGVSAVHCVTPDADEIELLAHSGASVVHCPRSNALLGCGIAPVRAMLDAGIPVGLGTDSPASAPSFDLLEEARSALELARARERRPDALSAPEALELATLGGARALGLEREIGSLTPGKLADLAVVDLAGALHQPIEDPVAATVFAGSASRVSRTILSGEIRYERGGFAWPEVREAASAARALMLASAPTPR
ncbi:MAG: amidohydrolase family protein [Thermoleophilia bacterium]